MARTTKGGTGTPPGGQITPQGPAAEPTTEERLGSLETSVEFLRGALGERGNEFATFLVSFLDRYVWLEKAVRQLALSHEGRENHNPHYAFQMPSFILNGRYPHAVDNPTPPSVEAPEHWRQQEETEEEDGESEDETG